MKVMTPGKIHFDHIMWEPDGRCEGKCAGCYQAQSPSRSYQGPLQDQILKYIFEERTLTCDQLTISLNRVEPSEKLVDVLRDLWTEKYRCTRDSLLPELCVTVRNVDEFFKWKDRLDVGVYAFSDAISLVSLSEMDKNYVSTFTLQNRNFLVDRKDIIFEELNSLRYANSIYFILKKPVLGKKQNLDDLENWFLAFDQYHDVRGDIKVPDTCIVESIRYLKTGYVCSAGLEKTHVWADGVATACPYDSLRQSSNNGRSLFAQLDQMNRGDFPYNQYPIEYCGIPVAIRELSQKNPALVNSVVRKLGL